VRGTLFDPEFGGLSGRYPIDQGLYRLKHIVALKSGFACLNRCNSSWFYHTHGGRGSGEEGLVGEGFPGKEGGQVLVQ
jgi:hypothetical protein